MLMHVLLMAVIAQTPSSPGTDARTINATRAPAWLAAAYPALRRGDVGIRISGDGERLHLEVLDEPAGQLPGPRASEPTLVVDLRYAADGRVEEATTHGPLVQSAALDALKKAIAAHPDWTMRRSRRQSQTRVGSSGPPPPPRSQPPCRLRRHCYGRMRRPRHRRSTRVTHVDPSGQRT